MFAHPLRAYDAVQLGAALVAEVTDPTGFQFWTADRRQAQVATVEGLFVNLVG